MAQDIKHRTGFVTIVGRPNVGKSTLLNMLIGEKIAITSPRPQTTRKNMNAILSEQDYQMIFVDTPGMHNPKNKLGEYMMTAANATLSEVDAIVYVYDASYKSISSYDKDILASLSETKKPVFIAINKVDSVKKTDILEIISAFSKDCHFTDIIPISAKTGEGVQILKEMLIKTLPEGPALYDEEILTDTKTRDIVSEIIREKILLRTSDEIPHGTNVEIVTYEEPVNGLATTITANIICEKDSHKGILIGKGGQMLKQIGMDARKDIEKLISGKVNLKLFVKVREDWRNNPLSLKNFGFDKKEFKK